MSLGWYHGHYLPHFDSSHVIQTVTFRLIDSMPAERRREWETFMGLEESPARRARIQGYLDIGYGSCWLGDPRVAAIVEQELLDEQGGAYRLLAWVIMPNHVHVLIETQHTASLPEILRRWKGRSARYANLQLGRTGPFWFRDYFDRYIRDQAHFEAAIRYIEENPVKAGLVAHARDFRWSSARHRAHAG